MAMIMIFIREYIYASVFKGTVSASGFQMVQQTKVCVCVYLCTSEGAQDATTGESKWRVWVILLHCFLQHFNLECFLTR